MDPQVPRDNFAIMDTLSHSELAIDIDRRIEAAACIPQASQPGGWLQHDLRR